MPPRRSSRLQARYAPSTAGDGVGSVMPVMAAALQPVMVPVQPMLTPEQRVPGEILAAIFEEFVAQWEAQDLDYGWSRPLPESVVSKWRGMRDWKAEWSGKNAVTQLTTVPDATWNGLYTFLFSIILVSKRWMNAALGSHRLWRNIRHVQHTSYSPEELLAKSLPVGRWMYHSGAIPLRLVSVGSMGAETMLQCLTVQNVGGPGRISHLQAEIPHPQLEGWLIDHLKYCSNLQSLSLKRIMAFPGQNLIEALSTLPKLRSLRLHVTSCVCAGHARINFYQLQNLEVVFNSGHRMTPFFHALHAPKLERLLIAAAYDEPLTAVQRNTNFRPLYLIPSLKELIFGRRIPLEDMTPFVHRAPNLETLRFFDTDEWKCSKVMFSFKYPDRNGRLLAPKLRVLAFSGCGIQVIIGDLFGLISARRDAGTPIEAVGMGAEDMASWAYMREAARMIARKTEIFEWTPPALNLVTLATPQG